MMDMYSTSHESKRTGSLYAEGLKPIQLHSSSVGG